MADFIHSLIASGKPLQRNSSISVCSKAGINLLSKEKVKLEAMADSLKYGIEELSSAKSRTEFASKALLTLRLVKANCDAFISLASEFTEIIATVAPNPASKALAKGARAVSDGYSTTQNYVDVNAAADNGQIDVKGLNKIAKTHTKKVKGAKYLHANVNIVTDAMKQDYKALQKDLAGFVYDVHKDASKLVIVSGRKGGYLSKTGARRLAKTFTVVDAAKSAVTAGFDYSNALEKAFDEKIADDDFARELADQIRTATTKLRTIQGKLSEVNKALYDCNAAMNEQEFATSLMP